jgi:transposase
MNNQAVQEENRAEAVHVAFELSRKKWKLGFSDGKKPQVRQVTITAGELKACGEEIEKAKQRLGLKADVRVRSCYEAGREGFWLHRALTEMGVDNIVVDAASIEVNRRQRRAKTDRMDVEKLARQLERYWRGEQDVWRVVRVASPGAADLRQLHREVEILKQERMQHRVRMQSLLLTQGMEAKVGSGFLTKLEQLRNWRGDAVAPQLKRRIEDEYHRLQLVEAQIREIKQQQLQDMKRGSTEAVLRKVQKLQQLVSIGLGSSWVFVMELFGWRQFGNRREVAAAVGLAPTPYNSGDSQREQGISRAGNRRVRKLLIEIAGCWLRLQPDSELSRWYQRRFGAGGARMRRLGIVAMARRLAVELWRYVEFGTIPAGAKLKKAAVAE